MGLSSLGTCSGRSTSKNDKALPWLSRLSASFTPPSSTSSSTKFMACRCGNKYRCTRLERRWAKQPATTASVIWAAISAYSAGCQQRVVERSFRNPQPVVADSQLRPLRHRRQLTSRLAAITQPTLVLHGSCDVIVPLTSAAHLGASIPNAKLMLAGGAGHVPTITRAQWVAQQIADYFA